MIIDNGVEKITLEPDNISISQINVTIPPLNEGSYGMFISKGDKRSKMMPFMVEPPANIITAIITRNKVMIIGSGFIFKEGIKKIDPHIITFLFII